MDDKRKKVTEFDIVKIKDEVFFRPLLAAYALQNNLCQTSEIESYLNSELGKFPDDVKLLRNFLEHLSDEEPGQFTLPKSEKGDSAKSKESNTRLDLGAMTRQFSSSNSGRKK